VRTCITEYKDEKHPNKGYINHDLDEETAQEWPDGRVYLAFICILTHDGFSTRHIPVEEGLISGCMFL